MSREAVLEDVLRNRAADVEPDPGALAAILAAPAPSSTPSESEEPSQPSPSTVDASARTGASTGGGSWFTKLLGLTIVAATATVAATVAYAAVPRSEDHCPGLERTEEILLDIVEEEVGERPDVSLTCGQPAPTYDEILTALHSDQARADLKLRRNDVVALTRCADAVATPVELSTLLDKFSLDCVVVLG